MTLFTLLSGKTVHLKEGQKIIPKEDATLLLDAKELIENTKQEIEEFHKKAEKEAEKLKKEAKEQGFQEGLESFNKQLAYFDTLCKTIKEETKDQVLPIILSSLKKIIGQELKLAPKRVVDIILQALKPILQHHHVTIFVNKDDLTILEENKDILKKALQQVEVFSLQEREDIQPGGCIIETEAGIINAQLDNQLRALEAALKNLMRKNS